MIDDLRAARSRAGRCRVWWCQSDHTAPAVEQAERPGVVFHSLVLGPFAGPPPGLTGSQPAWAVLIMDESGGGAFGEPYVRLLFHVEGVERELDLDTATAADVGELVLDRAGSAQRPIADALRGLYFMTRNGQ